MTAIHKIAKPTELQLHAENGLRITQDLKKLNEALESEKVYFRDAAGEETFDVVVPELGKVQVRKPSEGGIVTSTLLDVALFNALDQKTKHELISKGVVKITTTSKPPSKAAVVFTLNV